MENERVISEWFPFTEGELAAAWEQLGAPPEEARAEARETAKAWGRDDGWFGYAPLGGDGAPGWPVLDALATISEDARRRVQLFRAENPGL